MILAEAKRRVKVGSVIQAVGHYNPNATGPRTVTDVQTNGFWFDNEKMKHAWCAWPKAAHTKDAGPDGIVLLFPDGRPLSTLTIEKLP